MLSAVLPIQRGVTAVIGSGGKTTLLSVLGRELSGAGKVLLCTTTHFLPFEGLPYLSDPTEAELLKAFTRSPLLAAGRLLDNGKISALSLPFETLTQLADYVLVEADGSRQLPLKAHAAHEPVIPACAGAVICLVGASGFDRPIAEVVHRPELFCAMTGAEASAAATPALVAKVLRKENLADTVLVNQTDTPALTEKARQLALCMNKPVYAGSLQKGSLQRLS